MSDNYITIVSGMPRSGTSMMMQMLVAGGIPALTDQIREADHDNLQGYYEFEPVKRTKHDSSWLKNADGKVVKVIYMLLYDLPAACSYRVIFMKRSLDEVLASQHKMLQRRGEAGASVPDNKLREIFEGQLQKVDTWLDEQPNFEVLTIEHRDVLSDPAGQANQINNFLGASLDVNAMAAVVDPALYRQRGDN